uniref:Uncharacterized protein n=1 Tax=Acrobeloides nanus TaxID=290746 RepID=A0A914E1M6_9BILA
ESARNLVGIRARLKELRARLANMNFPDFPSIEDETTMNTEQIQTTPNNVVESVNKSKEEEITYEKCTPLAEAKKKKNPLEGNCQCDRCIRLRENCVKLNVSENLTHVDMHKE